LYHRGCPTLGVARRVRSAKGGITTGPKLYLQIEKTHIKLTFRCTKREIRAPAGGVLPRNSHLQVHESENCQSARFCHFPDREIVYQQVVARQSLPRAFFHPHHGRMPGRLRPADHMRRHQDQQRGVVLLVVLAGQVVHPRNLADARRAADGAAQ
jgi:hypothetical protein